MRRVVLLALALSLTSAASAQALTFVRLKARDGGANIYTAIRACESRPAYVRYAFKLHKVGEPSGTFREGFTRHQRRGCHLEAESFPDRYASGLWKLTVTLADSHGSVRVRSASFFVN